MNDRLIKISETLNSGEAAIIYTSVNRKYLTGFQSSLGYLVITKNRTVLLVDGRYKLAASQKVTDAEVVLLESLSKQLQGIAKTDKIKRVYVETEITLSDWNYFKMILPKCEMSVDNKLTDMLLSLRSVKNNYEVEMIVNAQRIAEKALSEVLNFIKPGVTEKQIANELEYRMKSYGADGLSFDTIAITGKKTAMPHGVPENCKVADGDFVTMDFGAILDGYHSDMTRTVAVGYADEEMKKVYDTVLRANINVAENLKPGMTGMQGDALARDIITAAGYGENFTHSTGHSVGLEIHEGPVLSSRAASVLNKGNIVTDEPGIYLDGKFGVRIEDMLLITDDGLENLTEMPKELLIL